MFANDSDDDIADDNDVEESGESNWEALIIDDEFDNESGELECVDEELINIQMRNGN